MSQVSNLRDNRDIALIESTIKRFYYTIHCCSDCSGTESSNCVDELAAVVFEAAANTVALYKPPCCPN